MQKGILQICLGLLDEEWTMLQIQVFRKFSAYAKEPSHRPYNRGRRAFPHGKAANRVRWGTKQP